MNLRTVPPFVTVHTMLQISSMVRIIGVSYRICLLIQWYFGVVYDYGGKADLSIRAFANTKKTKHSYLSSTSCTHVQIIYDYVVKQILAFRGFHECKKNIGGNRAFFRGRWASSDLRSHITIHSSSRNSRRSHSCLWSHITLRFRWHM